MKMRVRADLVVYNDKLFRAPLTDRMTYFAGKVIEVEKRSGGTYIYLQRNADRLGSLWWAEDELLSPFEYSNEGETE